MKTWTINTRTDGIVTFTLCAKHSHSAPSEGDRVVVTDSVPSAFCEVCRQDKIRAAIRSVGSVVA